MTVERFDARIGANIREFQRKIKQADQAMREMATGVDVDLDLATEEFFAEVQAVKEELRGLDNKDLRIQVDLAYAEFRRQLAEIYAMAETMDDYEIDVEVDAVITQFRRKLLKAKTLAQGLDDDDINIDVDLNTRVFNAQMARISAQIALLKAKDVWIGVKVKYNEFQRMMGRIASQMRNWGEIFSTQLTGALITLITTLPALISTLIGLIGSLGVMIGVLAGQFMIMASALSVAALGFVGLAAVAFPTIKALFDETAKLTAEQQRARDAWDGFVAVYDEMVKKTEGAVLTAFTKAMEGATKILQSLEPMILSVAKALLI